MKPSLTDGSYAKKTRAHTHKELIREWIWEPTGSSLNYIYVSTCALEAFVMSRTPSSPIAAASTSGAVPHASEAMMTLRTTSFISSTPPGWA